MKFFIFSQHVHYRSIDTYGRYRCIDEVHYSCSEKKNFFLGYIGLTEIKDYRKFQLRMALILEKIAKIDCVTGQLTDLVILGLKNNCINFFFPLSFWWNKLVILT